MRVIQTRLHGIVDYVVGVMLMTSPYVLGFADGGPAELVPVALGFAAVIYSVAHVYFLIGARNRVVVAFTWVWSYLTLRAPA